MSRGKKRIPGNIFKLDLILHHCWRTGSKYREQWTYNPLEKSIYQMNILLHDDFKQSKVKEYNEGFLALRNMKT